MVHHILCTEESDAKSWLFTMHDSLLGDEVTTMVVTLWAIWSARRKAIHESIFQSPYFIHGFVSSYLSEIKVLQPTSAIKPPRSAPSPRRWISPPDGMFKINVDAALSDTGLGAAATVCRDSTGLYLGSSAVVIQGAIVPAVVEAIACRDALSLAQDLGIQNFVVSSDC